MSAAAQKLSPLPATLEDLLSLPQEGRGFELVDGEIVEKQTSGEHGQAQAQLAAFLILANRHRRGSPPPGPSGRWWFATEVLIDFGPGRQFRPDVAGWRRERMPEGPRGTVVKVVPDWVCEIISPSNETHDTITKRRTYFRHRMPHYWLIDPIGGTLSVLRWTEESYQEVLSAKRGETVRAEPFQAIALQVGVLFGDDPDE